MRNYSNAALAALLPHPDPLAYKYSRGKLTLVVGSATYPGAACLAAYAGQRTGAGYTEVYVDDGIVSQVQQYRASLVVRPWSEWTAADEKHSTFRYPHTYVVGCGFDVNDPYIAGVTRQILKVVKGPVLVDGGALRMLPARKIHDLCSMRYQEECPTIITPHHGEARALAQVFGVDTSDYEHLALNLSRAYGCICVLKGPDTYISNGDETYCMTEGTAALSKAGTGDVLAGTIGALLAQGIDPLDSCMLGATLHARAGNLAASDLSDIAVCAEDIIEYLPAAILQTEALGSCADGPRNATEASTSYEQSETEEVVDG